MKYEDWYLHTYRERCETVWGFLNILIAIGVYKPWIFDVIDVRTVSKWYDKVGK